ncbi:hypothetical protein [Pelagimonas varians]|uniref:Uncharacterized protein n=1 Tax=Pelagimonas varians TaxID=696760 RepID=A0A238KXT2_9RHOB|nr:hypothetical protein [Pelagimonas varians]PYG27822.1 hypothetical protein C8N36_11498 [Pelagimonas varians]SMX47644.1 hypothetical protein PEV8663_03597 [Pelagimonas varians]
MTSYPPYQLKNLARTIEMQVPQKALRDALNRMRYGPNAPRSDERIYINPSQVTRLFKRIKGHSLRRRHSGQIRAGDWDQSTVSLDESRKFRACRAHFVDGVSWEDTGIIDSVLASVAKNGNFDGCKTREDILARYQRMDALHDAIKSAGRLQTMSERPEFFRREYDGVYVHIDRGGQPMLAGNGNHRMAIAKVLGLASIPAHLGVIHPLAFENGVLDVLRQPPPGD